MDNILLNYSFFWHNLETLSVHIYTAEPPPPPRPGSEGPHCAVGGRSERDPEQPAVLSGGRTGQEEVGGVGE